MKPHVYLILLILVATFGGAVSAQSTSTSNTAFTQVVVSKTTVNPSVLMVGDTGTITVTLLNTGTEAVPIARATLYTDGIVLLNTGAYDTLTNLGPDNSKDFTFQVQATGTGGLYSPRFYLDFQGAGSLSSLHPPADR